MKVILLLLLFCLFVNTQKWAVLIAGSHTYSNYRHQSDVFHAYQILIRNGFSKDRIITFAYDDIAHNIKNPFKGRIFNKPTYKEPGIDVYEGVAIDYKENTVNPEIFLAVLQGNKTAVKGKGTQRVLESGLSDNVFLYFSDHGAPGLIAFPSKYLYADQLISTFNKMNGRFNKLVFYLEACESGSMFTKLPNNTNIYALSAANSSESSWGVYCAPADVVQGKHIGSCLGDLFSINFLEDTEQNDIFSMTLNEQYQKIKTLTTKSHVLQWGDQRFANNLVSQFLSSQNRINLKKMLPKLSSLKRNSQNVGQDLGLMNSRTIKMQILIQNHKREPTQQNLAQFIDEVRSMQREDKIFFNFISKTYFGTGIDVYDPEKLNFECLRQTMDYYEQKCGRLSDYGLIYVKYFAKACEDPSEKIKESIQC